MTRFHFTQFPILKTDRLKLRQIDQGDLQDWLYVWQNPDVLKYLIDMEGIPDVKSIIDWVDAIFKQQTGIRWAITLGDENTLIGSCGFHLYNAQHHCVEIGYELHHAHWRQGIMREAITAVLDFCFYEDETKTFYTFSIRFKIRHYGSVFIFCADSEQRHCLYSTS